MAKTSSCEYPGEGWDSIGHKQKISEFFPSIISSKPLGGLSSLSLNGDSIVFQLVSGETKCPNY